jgi:hypothetical protein
MKNHISKTALPIPLKIAEVGIVGTYCSYWLAAPLVWFI